MEYIEQIRKARRIVIKVGTSTLTHTTGKLNLSRMAELVTQITDLHRAGKEITLVTSGAVGAGMGRLGLSEKPASIIERQALAAIGQGLLMHEYEKLFSEQGLIIAQILLTRDDLSNRQRYLNARNTILTLLKYQAVPIINENDTVATEELKIGENDTLSALVTGLIEGDLLLLLSDVDGLYTADPRIDPTATLISCVTEINENIKSSAGGTGSAFGSGGMVTKIEAAQMAVAAGATMVLMNGDQPGRIKDLFNGKSVGTVFQCNQPVVNSRKRWIAYGPQLNGTIVVDHGAAKALLKQGKSLLPSGINALDGEFEVGDLVKILNSEKVELGRGLSNYNSSQLRRILGKKSGEIELILGFKAADEVVHRDNLVITYQH